MTKCLLSFLIKGVVLTFLKFVYVLRYFATTELRKHIFEGKQNGMKSKLYSFCFPQTQDDQEVCLWSFLYKDQALTPVVLPEQYI